MLEATDDDGCGRPAGRCPVRRSTARIRASSWAVVYGLTT